MIKKIITSCIVAFIVCNAFAQAPAKDQDLISLKNGYQYLGNIVEQQPGKFIKLYRPTQNDTVIIKMEDVEKLSKIFIQTFSEKKRTKKDTTLKIGRFNNKKNIYHFYYSYYRGDVYSNVNGFGLSYSRSFNNNYFAGLSCNGFINQTKGNGVRYTSVSQYKNKTEYNIYYTVNQFQLLFENKFRISFWKPQNKRITTLLGVNVGYVFDYTTGLSSYPYEYVYEKAVGGFIHQVSLAFKVNPDNNSGFIIEPGCSVYPYKYKRYSSVSSFPMDYRGNGSGFASSLAFTFRFGYFF